MARPKKSQPVRGLSFEITVTPKRNGVPWPDVDPITFTWDKEILQWHESHADIGLMTCLRTLEQRVRKAMQVRGRK